MALFGLAGQHTPFDDIRVLRAIRHAPSPLPRCYSPFRAPAPSGSRMPRSASSARRTTIAWLAGSADRLTSQRVSDGVPDLHADNRTSDLHSVGRVPREGHMQSVDRRLLEPDRPQRGILQRRRERVQRDLDVRLGDLHANDSASNLRGNRRVLRTPVRSPCMYRGANRVRGR